MLDLRWRAPGGLQNPCGSRIMAILREPCIGSANGPPIFDQIRPPRARGRTASPQKRTGDFGSTGTRARGLAARALETFQAEVFRGVQAFRLREPECAERWHCIANRA